MYNYVLKRTPDKVLHFYYTGSLLCSDIHWAVVTKAIKDHMDERKRFQAVYFETEKRLIDMRHQ